MQLELLYLLWLQGQPNIIGRNNPFSRHNLQGAKESPATVFVLALVPWTAKYYW